MSVLKASDLKRILDEVRPKDPSRWLYDARRPGMPVFPPGEVSDSIYDIKSKDDIWKLQEMVMKYSV